jgi:uncharacterized membrane protein YedE/YeeE
MMKETLFSLLIHFFFLGSAAYFAYINEYFNAIISLIEAILTVYPAWVMKGGQENDKRSNKAKKAKKS